MVRAPGHHDPRSLRDLPLRAPARLGDPATAAAAGGWRRCMGGHFARVARRAAATVRCYRRRDAHVVATRRSVAAKECTANERRAAGHEQHERPTSPPAPRNRAAPAPPATIPPRRAWIALTASVDGASRTPPPQACRMAGGDSGY